MSGGEDVLIEQAGRLARIRLNRPQALNSLTFDMIRQIAAALDRFERDPQVACVLVSAEGGRAFCAGGDIRALHAARHGDPGFAERFFRAEYTLNARVAGFSKPYVAFMDGLVMGGGVGISAHGTYRLVTEQTRLAMPECGIGFFPDIGATWLLPRAAGELGTYLGLTGAQIGGADAILAGLADTFVSPACVADLAAALAALPDGADAASVARVVAGFAEPTPAAPLAQHAALIDAAFGHDTVEAILAALDAAGSGLGRDTRETLVQKSPTSLKLALRLLRLGRHSASLADCLEREFAACRHVMRGREFYEGVRAAVIDKDRAPRWQPATLDDVTEADIAGYFDAPPTPLLAPASMAAGV